jgi:hypothetical protein
LLPSDAAAAIGMTRLELLQQQLHNIVIATANLPSGLVACSTFGPLFSDTFKHSTCQTYWKGGEKVL